MTNAEKYKEVFGFEPNGYGCITKRCDDCPLVNTNCMTHDWWHQEYKENVNDKG